MFERSISFFHSYILTSRKQKRCSREEAYAAWTKVKQLHNADSYQGGIRIILPAVHKFGEALPYSVVIQGLEFELERGTA
ncbi:hypothetical protein [Bacillus infantis]|uniref:hypothetical protein n=1 Tax=Bacillus infantis TaxID=324767 RepID=UPI0020A0E53F|nr:hypothetical protein [Bacillus infantis]MCP1161379.1 hypothetical protein [Bacillus infantis]